MTSNGRDSSAGSRPRRTALVAGVLLAAFGLSACETGFIPEEPPILRSVSGIVSTTAVDRGDLFASAPSFSPLRFLGDWLFGSAVADIIGVTPAIGVCVQLARLDEQGNVVEVLGRTTTNGTGAYGFTDSPGVMSTLVVQAIGGDANTCDGPVVMRAVVTGLTVNISPATESVVQTVIDDIVRPSANVNLSDFSVQEIAALTNLVSGLDINVIGLTFDDAVAAIKAGAAPVLNELALGFSSPGVDDVLHNNLYGAVDFVSVLREPTGLATGDGGVELRAEVANWGFNDVNMIGGGQLFGLRTRHDLQRALAPQTSPTESLAGIQHIVSADGRVLVGDSTAEAVLGAISEGGALMVYPRALSENGGTTGLGRGIRIATRKPSAGAVLDNAALDPAGSGTEYHLVRLRQTMSGLVTSTGENAISLAAETGTLVFDRSVSAQTSDGSNTLNGAASNGAIASDRLLLDLNGRFIQSGAMEADPIDAHYLVIIDGTMQLRHAVGPFLGQGFVAGGGDIVSLQTASNLLQIPLDVLGNDSDADAGDDLVIIDVVPGALGGAVTISASGRQILYTPPVIGFDPDNPEPLDIEESFSYTVSDGRSSSQANVRLNLTSTNRPPTANDDSYTVAARSVDNMLDVLANDVDPDVSQGLTVIALNTNNQGFADSDSSANIIGSGAGNRIRYVPGRNHVGPVSFGYTMRDSSGAQSNATVTVTTVDAGENTPPIAADDAYSVTAGSVARPLDVLANDRDEDLPVQPLAVIAVASPSTQGGTVEIEEGSQRVLYTAPTSFTGADTFSYTLSDGIDDVVATVTVTVTENNTTPVAVDDEFRVAADSSGNVLDVLANDSDADAGDTLVVSAVVSPTTTGGTVTLIEDGGRLSYSPAQGASGPDTFQYTVSDGAGGTATAIVTVNVGGANAAPVVNDDFYRIGLNGANNLFVLANDFDPDVGDTLTLTEVSEPDAGGEVVILTGGVAGPPNTVLQYQPAANYRGEETFTYTATDGTTTSTATVTVIVAGGNSAPTAVDDSFSVVRDGVDLSLRVLDNDIEPDLLDALSITEVGAAGNGSVTIAPGGTRVLYTPAAGYTGPDSFGYTISDESGATSTATVSITVTENNTAPVAEDDLDWNLVLPTNPELWTTNLMNNEMGVAIRKGSGLGVGAVNGRYNLVQHAGYLFANGTDTNIGSSFSYGTLDFNGAGGIGGGNLFSKRAFLDVEEALEGKESALLFVPLPPTPDTVSGSYDVAVDGTVTLNMSVGDDTVLIGRGAVSSNGEVITLAVRIEEGGDDSGRGLLFLVRQP